MNTTNRLDEAGQQQQQQAPHETANLAVAIVGFVICLGLFLAVMTTAARRLRTWMKFSKGQKMIWETPGPVLHVEPLQFGDRHDQFAPL